jgi:tetratricopeptide (TPR) repeat protein
MNLAPHTLFLTGALAAALLSAPGSTSAQGYGGNKQNPPPASTQTPPPASGSTDKSKSNSLALDDPNAPAPATPEEDAAFKAFSNTPATDQPKRIELGEAFVQKYPNSRYRPPVYSALVMAYVQNAQVDKMEAAADKELALNPNDVQVLAIVAQTLPRAINSKTPDPAKQLAKAEQYSRKAIELTPTIPKPENITDENFSAAKNQTLAMAHGGLGLVLIRRGQFSEAIPELNQSVTLDPTPDQVNLYLLGMANAKTSHWDDAVNAYNKCAAMTGAMQETCKKGAAESKKLAGTQLSAPK